MRNFQFSIFNFQFFFGLLTVFLLVMSCFVFVIPVQAGTAGLYLAPASGNNTVGQIFSVAVHVVTGGEYINAVAANLSYPADLLEATGVTTNGSFITIWAEKSAADGSIRLSGGLPTPGFSGEGLVAQVSFKVKAKGLAGIFFADGTAVVRDSDNQNILTSKFGADFSLTSVPPTATSAPVVTTAVEPTATAEPTPTATPILTIVSRSQTTTPTVAETVKKEEGREKEKFSFFSFFLGFAIATLLWAGGIGVYFFKKDKAS